MFWSPCGRLPSNLSIKEKPGLLPFTGVQRSASSQPPQPLSLTRSLYLHPDFLSWWTHSCFSLHRLTSVSVKINVFLPWASDSAVYRECRVQTRCYGSWTIALFAYGLTPSSFFFLMKDFSMLRSISHKTLLSRRLRMAAEDPLATKALHSSDWPPTFSCQRTLWCLGLIGSNSFVTFHEDFCLHFLQFHILSVVIDSVNISLWIRVPSALLASWFFICLFDFFLFKCSLGLFFLIVLKLWVFAKLSISFYLYCLLKYIQLLPLLACPVQWRQTVPSFLHLSIFLVLAGNQIKILSAPWNAALVLMQR